MPIKPTKPSTTSHVGTVLTEKSKTKERLAFAIELIDEISENENPDAATVQLAERQVKQLGPLDISQEDLRINVALLLGKIALISQRKFPSSALWHYDQWLQLRQASPKDYLDLLKIIAEQSNKSTFFLLDNLDKLNQTVSYDSWTGSRTAQRAFSCITNFFTKTKGIVAHPLSLEERFELAYSIVNQGPRSAQHLLKNFSQLGPFDIHQPTTRKQIIDFFDFITTKIKTEDSFKEADEIISFDIIKQLDPIIKQLANEPLETIVDFAQQCIGLGEPSIISLAKNLPLLIPQGLSPEQCFDLALNISAQGPQAAHALVKVYNQLPLDKFSTAQLLELATKILDQGEYAADVFAEKIPDLKARRVSTNQCIELFHRVVETGGYAAGRVAEILEMDALPWLSPGLSFDLAQKITARSQVSAGIFARTFDYQKAPWSKLTPKQRFALAETIVYQGENGASQVLDHYDQFGLSETPHEQLQDLASKILFSGPSACAPLLNHLSGGHDPFHLQELPLQERVNLSRECVQRHGMNVLITLGADPFSNLSLNELTYPERLELNAFFSEYSDRNCAPTINCFEQKKFPGQTESEEFQTFLEFSLAPHRAMTKVPLSEEILKNSGPIINLLSDATKTEEIKEVKLSEFKEFIEKKFPFVSPLVEKASQEKDPFVRKRLINWLAYTAGVLSSLDTEQVKALEKSQILSEIYAYRDPHMRYRMVRKLSFLSADTISSVSAITQNKKSTTKLAGILLASLQENGVPAGEIQGLIGSIESTRGFRDFRNTKTLIDFLYATTSSRKLSAEKNIQVIALPYKQPPAEVIKQLSLVNLILKTFGEEKFDEAEKIEPEKILIEALSKSFAFSHPITDMDKKYERTFGSFRDNTALLTYRNRLDELSSHERDASVALLTSYVESVLEGTFPRARYRTENNLHLQKVFGALPGLKEKWSTAPKSETVSEVSSRFKKTFASSAEEKKEIVKTAAEDTINGLKTFIQEHHELVQCKDLQRYQQAETSKEQEEIKVELLKIKKAQSKKLEMIKKIEQKKVKEATAIKFLQELKIERENFDNETIRKEFKEKIEVDLAKADLQLHLINLCDPKKPLKQKQISIKGVRTSLDTLPRTDNLRKAFDSTIETFSEKFQPATEYFIEESDEPCDLLQQGSEFGTCQKVDGDVRTNKCLAGALMDGKIKLLTVKGGSQEKSKESPMLARAIMRLLWDETKQKPVLFLEGSYGSHPNHETFEKAIKQRAIMRAQELGVSLVFQPFTTAQDTLENPYSSEVESLGGFAPFEYTDSTTNQQKGVQEGSKYRIGHCRALYQSQEIKT